MLMAIFIKVSGQTEKPMEWESSSTQMDPCMKVNGRMTNNMDSEQSPGTTTRSNSQEISLRAKRPERADLNSKVAIMKAISSTVSSMELASITLLILADFMKDNSKITIWKAKEK
jgi:hypothetical protein